MLHSLISPSDYKNGDFDTPELFTDQEVKILKSKINKDVRDLQYEKFYCDPGLHNQQIGLVSFVPSKGATPDKDGFFGMMKLRGNFVSEIEANQRAEDIIKNVDSYHQIYHCKVGCPFPITNSLDYSEEVKEIDIKKKTTEIISEDILTKKKENMEEMKDIKQREKNLLDQSKGNLQNPENPMDPYDEYIMSHVKRSQLLWTYKEAIEKIDKMKISYDESIKRIKELEETNPEYKSTYKQKYMEARESAGLKNDNETSFIQFMNYDIDFDWDDVKKI